MNEKIIQYFLNVKGGFVKKKTFYLLAFAGILAVGLSAFVQVKAQSKTEVKTVPQVDIIRYAGKWYEIAKYPNRFQKQCVANTTAVYNLTGGGNIEVINSCQTQDGKTDEATGRGKIADKKTYSKLKVRFAPSYTSFLPFVWADYWIIDLDSNYQYAVVGTPKRDYLWILSRTPQMDENTYQEILNRVRGQGFDTNKLVKTPQNK